MTTMTPKTIHAALVRTTAIGALVAGVVAVAASGADATPTNVPATYYAAPTGSPRNAPCTTSARQPCDLATAIAEEASLGDGGTGNTISLANGTYTTAVTLGSGNDNVLLEGANKTKALLTSAVSGPVVNLSGADGVVVEDLTVRAVAGNGAAIVNSGGADDTLDGVDVAGNTVSGVPSSPADGISLTGGSSTYVLDVDLMSTSQKACTSTVKSSNVDETGWTSGILTTKKSIPRCATTALVASGGKVLITYQTKPTLQTVTCAASVTGPATLAISSCTSNPAIGPASSVNFHLTNGVPADTAAGILLGDGQTDASVCGGSVTGPGIGIDETGGGIYDIEGVTVSGTSVGIDVAPHDWAGMTTDIVPTPATGCTDLPGTVFPPGVNQPTAPDSPNVIGATNQVGILVDGASATGDNPVTIGAANARNAIAGADAGVSLDDAVAGTTDTVVATNNAISSGSLGGIGVELAGSAGAQIGPGNTISGAEWGVALGSASHGDVVTLNTVSSNSDDGVVVVGPSSSTLPDYGPLASLTAAGAGNQVTDNVFSHNGQANILDYTGSTEVSAGVTLTLQQGTGLASGVGIVAGTAPTSINVTASVTGVVLTPGDIIRVGTNNCGPQPVTVDTCSFFVAPLHTVPISTSSLSPTAVNVVTLNPVYDAVASSIAAGSAVTTTVLTTATSTQAPYTGNTVGTHACTPSNTSSTAALQGMLGNPVVGYLDC